MSTIEYFRVKLPRGHAYGELVSETERLCRLRRVNADGSPFGRCTHLLIALRSDLEPMQMNLHYGELEPVTKA